MTEKKAYLEIAKNYINSCFSLLESENPNQEVIGFDCYHAFESLACAYNVHYGRKIPSKHDSKLAVFMAVSKSKSPKTKKTIAPLCILLFSCRSKFLYPEILKHNLKTPNNQISLKQAKTLTKRVSGLIKIIEKEIK